MSGLGCGQFFDRAEATFRGGAQIELRRAFVGNQMNIHDRSRLIPAAAEPPPRYEAAAREHHPERNAAIERMWAIATAPILGSSLVFPRRFDHAVDKLLRGSGGDAVVPEHAIRYFGQVLHLDIDPFRLEARIADYISVDGGARWMGTSFLDTADWSDVITPIGKSPIHREMHALVAAGNDFRDSGPYKALVNAIALGKPSKRNGIRLSTVEEVEAYLRYCRDLIKSMRKRGVVRHREVGGFHRLRVKHRDARSPVFDSTERDIGVAIDAEGRLIRHLGGKHRTAIAQALGLKSIPVEVRLVHVRWLAHEMRRTGLPAHMALVEGIRALGVRESSVAA